MIYLIFYALDRSAQQAHKVAASVKRVVAPPFLYVSTKFLERFAIYIHRRQHVQAYRGTVGGKGGVDKMKPEDAAKVAGIDVGRKDWWNQS